MKYIGKQVSYLEKTDELSIVILPLYDKTKSNLLLAWLVAWTLCGAVIISQYFSIEDPNQKIALIVWLAFWFYFEFIALRSYRWRRSGKEKVRISNENMTIRKTIGKKVKPQEYRKELIKDLEIIETKKGFFETIANAYWSVGGETLQFSYYGKKIGFGLQLKEEDAKALKKLMMKYLK